MDRRKINKFVEATIAPSSQNVTDLVAPPNYYTQNAFVKKLDANGVFVVDDNNLINEQISTTSGVFVWLVNRGVSSMWRMGFVPQGATTTTKNSGFNASFNFALMAFDASGSGGNIGTFTWVAPTAIPYSSYAIPSDQISVSPQLDTQFSKARLFAGTMQVTMDSQILGAVPGSPGEDIQLNGSWTTGVVNDTRLLSQNLQGASNGNWNCFDESDIVQMSLNEKEGILNDHVKDPMISVVGPDITPFYQIPNADTGDEINGQWAQFPITGYVLPISNGGPGIVMDGTLNTCYSAWISPWSTTFEDSGSGFVDVSNGAVNAICQNINFGPINLAGVLDIKVTFFLAQNLVVPDLTTNVDWDYQCHFVHVFATACSTGAVQYQFFREDPQSVVVQKADTAPTAAVFTTSPRNYFSIGGGGSYYNHALSEPVTQAGFTGAGMYIGTQIQLVGQNGVLETYDPTPGLPGGVLGGTLYARARNLFSVGELGPAHVIRYDNLSWTNANGQSQLRVNGQIYAQCIPEGSLAPFSRELVGKSQTAADINSLTFLAELYNSKDSPFKRNWRLPEYLRFITEVLPNYVRSNFTGLRRQNPKIGYMASATADFHENMELPEEKSATKSDKDKWFRFFEKYIVPLLPNGAKDYEIVASLPQFAEARKKFLQRTGKEWSDPEVVAEFEKRLYSLLTARHPRLSLMPTDTQQGFDTVREFLKVAGPTIAQIRKKHIDNSGLSDVAKVTDSTMSALEKDINVMTAKPPREMNPAVMSVRTLGEMPINHDNSDSTNADASGVWDGLVLAGRMLSGYGKQYGKIAAKAAKEAAVTGSKVAGAHTIQFAGNAASGIALGLAVQQGTQALAEAMREEDPTLDRYRYVESGNPDAYEHRRFGDDYRLQAAGKFSKKGGKRSREAQYLEQQPQQDLEIEKEKHEADLAKYVAAKEQLPPSDAVEVYREHMPPAKRPASMWERFKANPGLGLAAGFAGLAALSGLGAAGQHYGGGYLQRRNDRALHQGQLVKETRARDEALLEQYKRQKAIEGETDVRLKPVSAMPEVNFEGPNDYERLMSGFVNREKENQGNMASAGTFDPKDPRTKAINMFLRRTIIEPFTHVKAKNMDPQAGDDLQRLRWMLAPPNDGPFDRKTADRVFGADATFGDVVRDQLNQRSDDFTNHMAGQPLRIAANLLGINPFEFAKSHLPSFFGEGEFGKEVHPEHRRMFHRLILHHHRKLGKAPTHAEAAGLWSLAGRLAKSLGRGIKGIGSSIKNAFLAPSRGLRGAVSGGERAGSSLLKPASSTLQHGAMSVGGNSALSPALRALEERAAKSAASSVPKFAMNPELAAMQARLGKMSSSGKYDTRHHKRSRYSKPYTESDLRSVLKKRKHKK